MTPEELRVLGRVHGVLAWVLVAALAAALGLSWKRRERAMWGVGAAAALGAAVFGTGLLLHGPFQARLRQRLFLASEALGWLFERKEHAAFGALLLGLSGLFALVAARAARERGEAARLRRACALALGAALALNVFALVVSVLAARRVGF